MIDGLVEFLRAQLDDDERTAQWRIEDHTQFGQSELDPDQALAEVRAKRRILDRHSPHLLKAQTFRLAMLQCEHCADLCHSRSGLGCDEPIDAPWPCPDIRDLASVYANREGFRDEWRV